MWALLSMLSTRLVEDRVQGACVVSAVPILPRYAYAPCTLHYITMTT